MTFRIPPGLSQAEVMEHGYGIDGLAALRTIPREDLDQAERDLIAWLSSYGHEVTFA